LAANASVAQEKPVANQLFLKRFDNSSQYAPNTLQSVMIISAIRDWVKYDFNSASDRGVGLTSDCKADHITKMKFVVLCALEKAKELDPDSLKVRQESESTENDPAHAVWGVKIHFTAKCIERKLITFLCEMSEAEVIHKQPWRVLFKKRRSKKLI
jgi:hypothetical protein